MTKLKLTQSWVVLGVIDPPEGQSFDRKKLFSFFVAIFIQLFFDASVSEIREIGGSGRERVGEEQNRIWRQSYEYFTILLISSFSNILVVACVVRLLINLSGPYPMYRLQACIYYLVNTNLF